LRVSFESADTRGKFGKFVFTVVSKRRVTQVMGEARDLDKIGITPECGTELATDLGDFKGMR